MLGFVEDYFILGRFEINAEQTWQIAQFLIGQKYIFQNELIKRIKSSLYL